MKIIGIIQNLKEVESPEKNGYAFNYFVEKFRNDLEKSTIEDQQKEFTFRQKKI